MFFQMLLAHVRAEAQRATQTFLTSAGPVKITPIYMP